MEHVVFFPSAEGVASFRRVGSLEEAMRVVERLRNSDNITEFSVHALTPVPLAFRAYYHVEVPSDEAMSPAAPQPADEVTRVPAEAADVDRSAQWVAEAQVVEAPAVAEPAEVPAAAAAEAPADAAGEPVKVAAARNGEGRHAQAAKPAPAAAVPAAEEAAAQPALPVQPAGEPAPEPAVTEVVPAPSGRRSMGFFSR